MKKLYYFSKAKLQFAELKHYKTKFSIYLTIGVLCSVFLVYIVYSSGLSVFGFETYSSLSKENELLKKKLDKVLIQYEELKNQVDSLLIVNNELRIAANLEPLSEDEQMIGVGGGYFDNEIDFLPVDSRSKLQRAFNFIEEVDRKIKFERQQYTDISEKLKENKLLFESLPAIKPCIGTLASHGFGMRHHPILNISRMHEGIDIITDRGTPVHAAGNGTIDYIGYKGGLGLTVEIDHGFGYRTIYGHLSDTDTKLGKKVKRGEIVAKTGNSGLSSGPHLHYEVHHNGIKQNPAEFFFDDLNFFKIQASENN